MNKNYCQVITAPAIFSWSSVNTFDYFEIVYRPIKSMGTQIHGYSKIAGQNEWVPAEYPQYSPPWWQTVLRTEL